MLIIKIYLGFLAAVSLVALVMYGLDKGKAKAGAWRISEKTLLLTGFFGGAAGALLGMFLFRHKTKHWYFWLINFFSLALHATIFGILYTYLVI